MFLALTMCAASVYQMMRGCIVLIVAGLSRIVLRRLQFRHHLLSLAAIFAGVLIVGSASLHKASGDVKEQTRALGVILLLTS